MPAAQRSKEVRPFCHEHHVEMRVTQSYPDTDATAQAPTYVCTEPECPFHFNSIRGYFIPSRRGNTNEQDMVPNVRCLREGTPMYLGELDSDRASFRLWICPQCDGRRTNEEGLIGMASEKIQDDPGKSWVEPNP
jgi:hypothetical protein